MYILFGSIQVGIFPLYSIVFGNDIIIKSFLSHDFQICKCCRTLDGLSAIPAGCFWQVLKTNLKKHNDDVIMTSFYVVGI